MNSHEQDATNTAYEQWRSEPLATTMMLVHTDSITKNHDNLEFLLRDAFMRGVMEGLAQAKQMVDAYGAGMPLS